MRQQESIYNLIPTIVSQPEKPARHVSKHDPLNKPTGSTFGCQGKTRIEGSNLDGASKVDSMASSKDFGNLTKKPDPKHYLTKGSKSTENNEKSKQPSTFTRAGPKKPALVKRDERPVMGLKSSKDHVTANAVDTILAIPGNRARVQKQLPSYKNKADYGKVPAYLKEVKSEIHRENEMIEEFVRQNQQLQEEEERKVTSIDPQEREELINALKAKWDNVNSKYQKICHNIIFDTHGKIKRKETLENELKQIESDIKTLQRPDIAVARD